MDDYNKRMKEWITNMVKEELTEDDSWWNSLSASQQQKYIKDHPQSAKARDAKKKKKDDKPKYEPSADDYDAIYGTRSQSGKWQKPRKESNDSDIENQSQLSEKAKRDYKDEYKKFQSSPKAKKYRAELNKYNRKKGTYGNGDGKDASHKGGKIVGFEAQSKNRGRAEKSRLKKESFKENKDKVKKYMISKGDTEEDATEKLKYYDYIKKTYKGITPARMADIMGHLAKMESVNELTKMRPQVKKLLKQKGYNPIFNAISSSKQQLKQMRYSRGEIQDTLIDMFGDEDPKILQKIKESVNEVNMAHVLSKDLSKKKFKDLGIYLWHVLDLAINKDFKITSNGKLLAVNVDKINPKSLQNIKKRFGVDLQQLAKESINEKKGDFLDSLFPKSKVDKAVKIAQSMGGNMTGAVKKIERMFKGMSLHSKVRDALQQANESINEEMYFDPKSEFKKYMDKVFKQSKIKVIKFNRMKQSFHNGAWGGFYTVKSDNKVDMKGQGKVKRGSAVIPVYISRVGEIELGIRAGGFHIGKVGSSQVVKNLKDFKKGDLDESVTEMNSPMFKITYQDSTGRKKLDIMRAKNHNLAKRDFNALHKGRGFKILSVVKESINEDVYAIVDKFNQKKQDYDQVYFKDNNLNKVKNHMKKMGKKYGKMNLIKVKTNGKMSLVESVSKSQAQEIMRQLGGRKFEMLMGVKSKGVGKDGLIIHIGRNPKKVSHIIIDIDRGKDLYNLTFGKIFKYQFKVIKKLKGIYVDQLHDMIEQYTGLLTTFRKR